MTSTEILPPEAIALLKVAALRFPQEAQRAKHFLAKFYRVWHLDSHLGLCKSVLTPSGYPLEFTFRSSKSELNYTAEPGLANTSAKQKWNFIQSLSAEVYPQSYPLLTELILQPEQRFGCWIGVRHKVRQHSIKVYQEITALMAKRVQAQLYSVLAKVDSSVVFTPTLLGLMPQDPNMVEYYGKVEAPSFSSLHKLYRAAGKASVLPCILNYLSALSGRQREVVLGEINIGLSVKTYKDEVINVTLFCHANQLFSSDFHTRNSWLSMVKQLSGEAELYKQLTACFINEHTPTMHHGLIGLSVGESNKIECSIGLRPLAIIQ